MLLICCAEGPESFKGLRTVSSVFLAKYAALSSGLTLVPVSHGSAAVVTIATFLPGSRSVLSFFALFFLACLCSLCIQHDHGNGTVRMQVDQEKTKWPL